MIRVLILLACCTCASFASTCLPVRLAAYIVTGFSCTEDTSQLTFSHFSFRDVGVSLDASNVDVVPLTGGFIFTGGFLAPAGKMLDAVIGYTEVSSGAKASLASLSIGGYSVAGGGTVDVAETICVGASFASSGACPTKTVSLDVFDHGTSFKQQDLASVAGATVLGIEKDIAVVGGRSGVSAVSIIGNNAAFGVTSSEPAALPLVGVLLAAMLGSTGAFKRLFLKR